MPSTKTCTKCGETKSTAEFSRDRNRADGLQYNCKACNRAYRVANRKEISAKDRARRVANREAYAERDRAYYAANREARREYYRAYIRTHREAVREYGRAWRARNPEWCASYSRARYASNRAEYAMLHRAWRAANPEAEQEHRRRFDTVRREVNAAANVRGPWVAGEDRFLISRRPAWTCAEIAAALGRSYDSVSSRAAYLRKKGLIT